MTGKPPELRRMEEKKKKKSEINPVSAEGILRL